MIKKKSNIYEMFEVAPFIILKNETAQTLSNWGMLKQTRVHNYRVIATTIKNK